MVISAPSGNVIISGSILSAEKQTKKKRTERENQNDSFDLFRLRKLPVQEQMTNGRNSVEKGNKKWDDGIQGYREGTGRHERERNREVGKANEKLLV